MRGNTTVTEYIPEPPIVMSSSETHRRIHAYGDSMSSREAAALGIG
jgi:hypothetical protein